MTKLATDKVESKPSAPLSKFSGVLSTVLDHFYHVLFLIVGRGTLWKYINRIYIIDISDYMHFDLVS